VLRAWVMRAFSRAVLAVFYRRVELIGAEHVPRSGPLIVAANHQNGLVDPMLLLAAVRRPLVPLAKATLFRNPVVAPFLWMAGALPVHRREDAGAGAGLSAAERNADLFARSIAALRAGRSIVIFPEGKSQPEPVLLPLRTGAARLLLGAETADGGPVGVTLLPVGLIFHEPGVFRAGRAVVWIGPPVPTADCVAAFRTDPEAAVRRLTDRLTVALRERMVEADDRVTLRLARVLEAAWHEEAPGEEAEPARAEFMQRLLRAYRYLRASNAARVERFRQDVERYANDRELAGLSERHLSRPIQAARAWRYAAREGVSLLVGLPFAIAGGLIHALPYKVTGLAVRAAGPDGDERATYIIAAAMILYPLAWVAEAWIVLHFLGAVALAVFLAVLLPSAFFALTWRERLQRVGREARALVRLLGGGDVAGRFVRRRRALLDEMEALARLVPEEVMTAGRSPRPSS
jgi:glycerol-3-phosphate O-acyltransferase / dihydroxyacetone phosphate acyltransferase